MTWPSSFPVGTKGYLRDKIDDQLKRSGTIATQIDQAILDAVAIYQKHRFRFNEGSDYSLVTTIGQEFYGTSGSIAVTGVANNGAGLIRLTLSGLISGSVNLNTVSTVVVNGVTGTLEANGQWGFTIIDATRIDLIGSQFLNAYLGGGAATTLPVAGQGGLPTAGQVPYQIDYLAIQIGTARFELQRRQPEDIDLLTQSGTQRGQPHSYSYFNETIRLYPVPSAVYTIWIEAHEILAAPAAGVAGDSTTGNRWMTDGERLIRCRAKYELSVHNSVDFPNMAQLMHPDTGETADAFSELKRETNKITSTGKVRPTQF